MSLQHLTLGERIVTAARLAAAEHLRQDADEAGYNVQRLQREAELARANEARAAFANLGNTPANSAANSADAFRQDLYRQPGATASEMPSAATPRKRSTKRRVA